ncbi:MAG: CopD family protein [Planctomycetaceae bacterium]
MPRWLVMVHLLGLVLYAGGLLALTRLLGHAVRFPSAEARAPAYRIFKRMHFLVDWIGLALLLGTGLYMFLGDPAGKGYMKLGYFHMKLTCVLLLIGCDICLTRSLLRLQPEGPQPSHIRFKILHGLAGLALIGALVAVTIVKG